MNERKNYFSKMRIYNRESKVMNDTELKKAY